LSWLKLELFRNPVRKLGAKLAEGAFKSIWKKTNYEEYGGMPLLGVNGVCIIAYGASSPVAIKNAIWAATESIKHEINPKILRPVQSYNQKFPTVLVQTVKGSVSCDNCRDDGTDLGTRSV